jgi:threonine dehydratase
MHPMIDPAEIEAASTRIAPHVKRTPLLHSEPLSERHGADILIKSEHLQLTGSFKVRGSANFVHSLPKEEADLGVVTASSGNHGIGVSTAAASRGIAATIFLPSSASRSKVDQIRRLGAEIVTVDSTDSNDAENAARDYAIERNVPYVSPYNHPLIIAGQGTIGKEVLEDGGHIDAVVVAVGGGGLISGIATWIKTYSPGTRIIAASALNDRAMAASIEAGAIITPHFEPTFSDGTAGGLEQDSMTFAICRELVDQWVDVTEADIASAVTNMIDDHHQLVEGSAGVAIAAATAHALQAPGSRIVAVSCGANVSADALARMIIAAS